MVQGTDDPVNLSVETLDSSDSPSESEESADPPEEHASKSFSKLHLYQKCIGTCSRANKLKDTLAGMRKSSKNLEKEKKTVERTLHVLQIGKYKAEKYKYELNVENVEKTIIKY